MPKSKSSLTDLFRIATPAAVLALTAVTPSLLAEEDMTKPEIKGLASMGQLTVNPDTGLPEAFNLKSLPIVQPYATFAVLLPERLLQSISGFLVFSVPSVY